MIEQALLDTFEQLLNGLALQPLPNLVGVIEPAAAGDLPAIVLSIEENQHPGNGLGERASLVRDGVLPWKAAINLGSPFLPDDPAFSLLSADRKELTLPHGGLVRQDGSSGPLAAPDLQVTVAGAARTLVAANPTATQFTADPLSGVLRFGAALPVSGTVAASFVLGQWERRVIRTNGVLRLAVTASSAADVLNLSKQVLAGFGTAKPASGLHRLALAEVGAIAALPPPLAASQRVLRARFEFESTVDLPESSGGIIQRIPVNASVG